VRDDEPESGSIVRHTGPPKRGDFVSGEPLDIAAISAHIERHVGAVHMVYYEILSPTVHVDIHNVAPSSERPFHVLVTSGVSLRPMVVPDDAEEY
jgi:hypothetical protein